MNLILFRESCADLVDNKTCTLCGYKAKQMAALFLHIAVKHDKIQALLERDGHPLPKKGQRTTKQAKNQQEVCILVFVLGSYTLILLNTFLDRRLSRKKVSRWKKMLRWKRLRSKR